MEIKLHPIQVKILNKLLFVPKAKFYQLKGVKITSDHFSFHLSQMRRMGLVDKNLNFYSLTQEGKELANRMEEKTLKFDKQPKVSALVIGLKKGKDGFNFLAQKRLKQPYFGYWGFITGKVRWGERVDEAAKREFLEETGLTGNFTLKAIEHKIDHTKEDYLLEDKYFYIFKANRLSGKLKRRVKGGFNQWLSKQEILSQKKLFDDIPQIIELLRSKKSFIFEENIFKVEQY